MELFTLVLGAFFVAQPNSASDPAERRWTANSNSAMPAEISRDGLSPLGARPAAGSHGSTRPEDKAETAATSSVPRRTVTPELIAGSFSVPPGGTLVGRPLTLLEAIGGSTGRERQLEIIHAYWRLAAAVGEYRLRFDAAQRCRRLEPRTDEVAALRAERFEAAETLRNAELEAQRAQRTLAELVRWSPGASLPLPSDLPHAGPYRTNFDEVYAMQNVPAQARLIHRTLPLRRKGIEDRAAAVQAAGDALDAAADACRDGSGSLPAVASCLARMVEQRAALVGDVCQYNHEIADFAFSVAAAHATPRALAAMLILPGEDAQGTPGGTENLASPRALPAKQSAVTPPSGVEPATWINPVPEGRPDGQSWSSGADQPTLAPRRPTLAPLKRSVEPAEPAPVPPKPVAEDEKAAPASSRQAERGAKPSGLDRGEGGLRIPPAPPEKSGVVEKDAKEPPKDGKDVLRDPFPTPRIVKRVTEFDNRDSATASSPALYPALISVPTGARVKQLSMALHWNRNLPQDAGRPVALEECLRGLAGTDRRSVIDAYWSASQRAAEYQWLREQAELIEQMVPVALEHRRQPTGPLDMLRIRTARLACDADLAEAHVDLLQAAFELTRRAGRALDGPWLLPATAPHAGQYLLKLEAQRPEVVKLPAMQRLAAAVPALNDGLREQAATVVEADSVRAAATTAYRLSGKDLDPLLAAVRSQTVETLAFLRMLTAYNQAIAEYAVTVLPPAIPGDQLVQTLVILR